MRLHIFILLLAGFVFTIGCGRSEPTAIDDPVDPSKWVQDPKTGEMVPAERGP